MSVPTYKRKLVFLKLIYNCKSHIGKKISTYNCWIHLGLPQKSWNSSTTNWRMRRFYKIAFDVNKRWTFSWIRYIIITSCTNLEYFYLMLITASVIFRTLTCWINNMNGIEYKINVLSVRGMCSKRSTTLELIYLICASFPARI